MKLTMKQTVEQKQILSLSLFQLQSLNILELGNAEIGNLLHREYTENPFLEQKDTFSEDELQWMKYYKETMKSGAGSPASDFTERDEQKESQGRGVFDFDWRQELKEQLYRRDIESRHIRHMEWLINQLDDHGFLDAKNQELCSFLKITEKEMEKCREELLCLDPPGLGCRSMGEYLLFQLQNTGIHIPDALKALCLEHLNDITGKPYSRIAREIGASFADVRRWIQLLGTLSPYPIRQEETAETEYIIPDITIEKKYGEWQVVINDYYMRQYCISDFYKGMRKQAEDAAMQEYMDRKLLRARQLCEAVTRRNNTVWSMGKYLLNTQKSFFEGHFLCGLTYKQCGEALGIHESTVCRLIANKYVACPQGILPLGYFFSKGVNILDRNGQKTGTMGKTSVKELIAGYIYRESPQKPLSDLSIAVLLQKEYGLHISKRTVANYRDEMGIHSVYERKQTGILST